MKVYQHDQLNKVKSKRHASENLLHWPKISVIFTCILILFHNFCQEDDSWYVVPPCDIDELWQIHLGPPGGHSHYGGDVDIRLQRQHCCHPMTPYFCWLSLLSPKRPHIFWWNVGSSIALTQRPPHTTNHFCHFWQFCCCCKFLLLKRSLKDQKYMNFLTQCP